MNKKENEKIRIKNLIGIIFAVIFGIIATFNILIYIKLDNQIKEWAITFISFFAIISLLSYTYKRAELDVQPVYNYMGLMGSMLLVVLMLIHQIVDFEEITTLTILILSVIFCVVSIVYALGKKGMFR